MTHHDLSQGPVGWGRLGKHQLTDEGLLGSVHVISNASEDFLKEFAFVKKTQAKIILVADDASQSMRASVPVVRMQPLSTDAMTKKLFLELDWPAEKPCACQDSLKEIGIKCMRRGSSLATQLEAWRRAVRWMLARAKTRIWRTSHPA